MSSMQSELLEYFRIGEDIECYQSLEELESKCEFYLKKENEGTRKKIAENGYERVQKHHTYEIRIKELLRMLQI